MDHKRKSETDMRHSSATFKGEWRSKSCFRGFDFECRNERSMLVTRCVGRSMGMKNLGIIELYGEASDGPVMYEILTTVIAIAQSVPVVL